MPSLCRLHIQNSYHTLHHPANLVFEPLQEVVCLRCAACSQLRFIVQESLAKISIDFGVLVLFTFVRCSVWFFQLCLLLCIEGCLSVCRLLLQLSFLRLFTHVHIFVGFSLSSLPLRAKLRCTAAALWTVADDFRRILLRNPIAAGSNKSEHFEVLNAASEVEQSVPS